MTENEFSLNRSSIIQNDDAIHNAVTTMRQLIRDNIDPRRSISDLSGHPDEITIDNYLELYERDAVGARVVEVMPKESWLATPRIAENADKIITPFEQAFMDLSFSPMASFYEGTNPVWAEMQRVDILSGIGHYGVILLGVNDGQELHNEVAAKEGLDLAFLRSFSENFATVTHTEKDISHPRFGLPTQYAIQFEDGSREVHWSRIIHIADNRQSSNILGVPRMKPVFDRVLDLRKLYGSSAEMYFLGAFMGFSIEAQPNMAGDVVLDEETTREEMEKYINGLQRYIKAGDFHVKSLAPQVVDPTPQILSQLEAIALQIGIPKRVFMGTERGELASSQDSLAWQRRLKSRQDKYLTPSIIVPFIDRLIHLGVLPVPEKYTVTWDIIDNLSDEEKAIIMAQKTTAIQTYLMAGGENLMPPFDFLTKIMDFSEEEAQEMLEGVIGTISREGDDDPSES